MISSNHASEFQAQFLPPINKSKKMKERNGSDTCKKEYWGTPIEIKTF